MIAHTILFRPAENPSPTTAADSQDWQSWNERQLSAYAPRHVPESERLEYARSTSLRQFYEDCLSGRWEPIGRTQERKKATRQKDRQSINRWEKFAPRPEGFRGDWPGPSLYFLEQVGAAFFDDLYAAMRRGGLAAGTIDSTRSHLRTIINHAHRVRAIGCLPYSRPLGRRDPQTRIYSPIEVQAMLGILKPHPRLYAALWLTLHAGCRPVDAFCLRWRDFTQDHLGRRLVEFESIKTGKLQGVPISESTWSVIDGLPRVSDLVFDGYGNPGAADPEKSYQARIRNTLMKALIGSVGVHVAKPWQVARATCNERYESHRPGVGAFLLGHSLSGVNARNYRQPTEAVHEAVHSLPAYVPAERQMRLF